MTSQLSWVSRFSVAQRCAKSGMPVIREGRRVLASPAELNRWLGLESVQIATETGDLPAELKRGLSFVRQPAREETDGPERLREKERRSVPPPFSFPHQ
jgi:hypothetical protein